MLRLLGAGQDFVIIGKGLRNTLRLARNPATGEFVMPETSWNTADVSTQSSVCGGTSGQVHTPLCLAEEPRLRRRVSSSVLMSAGAQCATQPSGYQHASARLWVAMYGGIRSNGPVHPVARVSDQRLKFSAVPGSIIHPMLHHRLGLAAAV
jgi:hypothetical protein